MEKGMQMDWGGAKQFRRRRAGMTLIWFTIAMTALMAFVSLGWIWGASSLPRPKVSARRRRRARARRIVDQCLAGAIQCIHLRVKILFDGSSVIITGSDIDVGNWTTARSPSMEHRIMRPRAVSRTASGQCDSAAVRQGAGLNSCNVNGSSIAVYNAPSAGYALSAWARSCSMGILTRTVYNSAAGAYSASTALNNGDIGSNGDITLSGYANIKGDANPGPGHNITSVVIPP